MKPRAIVVGTAGVDSGDQAVAWAAREACLRRLPLRIMHVLEWNTGEAREADGSTYVERVWSSSAALTSAAIRHAHARRSHPQYIAAPGRAAVLIGRPARAAGPCPFPVLRPCPARPAEAMLPRRAIGSRASGQDSGGPD